MTLHARSFLLRGLLLSVACFLMASPAAATLVYSNAQAYQLENATITVSFQNAGVLTPVVITAVGNTASASVTNVFSFSITGGTFTGDWTLTNNTTNDFITGVQFDLTNSVSLFDTSSIFGTDGVNSTPNSETGDAGVLPQTGPSPLLVYPTQTESVLWTGDPLNVSTYHDMYLVQTLAWANGAFGVGGVGTTATWLDDTDTWAPEPETFLLMGGGLLALGLWRKRAAKKHLT